MFAEGVRRSSVGGNGKGHGGNVFWKKKKKKSGPGVPETDGGNGKGGRVMEEMYVGTCVLNEVRGRIREGRNRKGRERERERDGKLR